MKQMNPNEAIQIVGAETFSRAKDYADRLSNGGDYTDNAEVCVDFIHCYFSTIGDYVIPVLVIMLYRYW